MGKAQKKFEWGDTKGVMNRLVAIIFVLIGSSLISNAQKVEPKIFTEHPPITKGVFANLSYPAGPILGNSVTRDDRKTFKLRNGIFRPAFDSSGYIERTGAYLKAVDFVDVTGDGVKEGIATLGPIHQGNAVWYGIYIFSMSKGRPMKVLWSFATGDRGVGGLKRVYARRGHLVVELWGWDSGPDNPPTSHIDGQAGSSWFTRREYTWNGKRFSQRGKTRIFEAE